MFAELEEPDNDDEPVGGAVVVRLQVALGAEGVRWSAHAARALRPHLEAGHRALQQVSRNTPAIITKPLNLRADLVTIASSTKILSS